MEFNVEKKELFVGKTPKRLRVKNTGINQKSLDYKKFLDGVEEILRNELIPAINKAGHIYAFDDVLNPLDIREVSIDRCNSSVISSEEVLEYAVNVTFECQSQRPDEVPRSFTVLKLPYMYYDGSFKKNDKRYTFNELIREHNTLSYKEGEIVVRGSNPTHILTFKKKDGLIKIYAGSTSKVSLTPAVFSMYDYENGVTNPYTADSSDKINRLLDLQLPKVDRYKKDGTALMLESNIDNMKSQEESKHVLSILLDNNERYTSYDFSGVRDELNLNLSLYAAEGKILASDVDLGNEVIEAGSLITLNLIEKLHRGNVFKVNLLKPVDLGLIGKTIGEIVMLPGLPVGMKITEGFKSIVNFPYEDLKDFRYLPDMGYEKLLMITPGTPITEELLDILAAAYVEEIVIKMSSTKKKVRLVSSFLSNRAVLSKEIGVVGSKWSYCPDGVDFPKSYGTSLTYNDLLAITSLLYRPAEEEGLVSDAESITGRKKVATCDILLKEALSRSINKTIKTMVKFNSKNSREEKAKQERELINGREAKWWKDKVFYVIGKNFNNILSDDKILEDVKCVNPLSYVSSVNKIINNGQDIPEKDRLVNLDLVGRICPYEIPQSSKLGFVNYKTRDCKINNTELSAPLYKLVKKDGKLYVDDTLTYYTDAEAASFVVSSIDFFNIDEETLEVKNNDANVTAFVTNPSDNKRTLLQVRASTVEYITTSADSMFSNLVSSMALNECDDSVRVAFGTSMLKQVLPNTSREVPIIRTQGWDEVLGMTDYFDTIAKRDGLVLTVGKSKVKILELPEDSDIDIEQYEEFMFNPDEDVSELDKYIQTYSYTSSSIHTDGVVLRTIEVSEGGRVKKGDTIISSNYSKDGIMAIGVNALVGYEVSGYNYEDAVRISEAFSQTKAKTLRKSKQVCEVLPAKADGTRIIGLDKSRYINQGDKICEVSYKNKGKKEVKTIIAKRELGYIVKYENNYLKSETNKNSIEFYGVRNPFSGEGEKLANGHGNKGVISRASKRNDMAYLSNGYILDVLYNPFGVVTRRNFGQIKEINISLCGYVLGIRFLVEQCNNFTLEEVRELMLFTYIMANAEDNELEEQLQPFYDNYPDELIDYCKSNRQDILKWKGVFDKEGNAYTYEKNGKHNSKVAIGTNYIYVLDQSVDKKINARGGYLTSQYNGSTLAPTKGIERAGGQRIGQMEVAALLTYEAYDLLDELLNERCDNPIDRANITADMFHSNSGIKSKSKGIRLSTIEFVKYMKVLGVKVDLSGIGLEEVNDHTKYEYPKAIRIINASKEEIEKVIEDDEEDFGISF